MSKTITVWITKYALTSGMFSKPVDDCGNGLVADRTNRFTGYYHGEGREWHRTLGAAVAKAQAMRVAKIKSLRKQIAKLESLTFEEAT